MLNPEVESLLAELQDHLSLQFPSVDWVVSHQGAHRSLEPLVNIDARRHRFEGCEAGVQCTFRLWESLDPANGNVMPHVWRAWALETLAQLECA